MKRNTPGGASISNDEIYRWHLYRDVEPLTGRGRVAFLMLNPSTADGVDDDPTVRKCIGFTRRWGFAYLSIVNLFAFRSTDATELSRRHDAGVDIIGPSNNALILGVSGIADRIVVAWGDSISTLARPRGADVVRRLAAVRPRQIATGGRVMCPNMGPRLGEQRSSESGLVSLGRTKNGNPRHPLMLSYETALEPFEYPIS